MNDDLLIYKDLHICKVIWLFQLDKLNQIFTLEKWVEIIISYPFHFPNCWLASGAFQGGYLENPMQLWPCTTQCRQAVYGEKPPLMGWFWLIFGGWDFYRISTPLQGGVLDFFFSKESQGVKVLLFFLRETCKKKCSNIFFLQTSRWIIIQSNWLVVVEKSRWLYFSAFSSSCQLKPTKPTDQKSPTQRRPCEAEAELRATWQSLQRVMGSRHPLSLTTLQILGVGWWILGLEPAKNPENREESLVETRLLKRTFWRSFLG